MTFITNTTTTFQDSQYDAFARIRMSQPHTLFQVSHNVNVGSSSTPRNDVISQKLTGGGSIEWKPNESAVNMIVSSNGDDVIRQSRTYITYQPGKSLLILCTGVLNANSNISSITSRIGYFDNQNGIFFKCLGNSTLSIVLRSYTSGSVVDSEISQSNWNIDKMNGTGISGITLNVSYAQIFIIDLEWLGVGRVRVGIIVDGKIYYAHQFLNANSIGTTYMTRGSLPIRYQISSTSGAGMLKMICATAISEGGFENIGNPFSVGLLNEIANITNSNTTPQVVTAIKLRTDSPYNRVVCKLLGAILMSPTNANMAYSIYNYITTPPTFGGTPIWNNVNTNYSVMQYLTSISNSTVLTNETDGIKIFSGFFSNNTDFDASTLEKTVEITSNVDGSLSNVIVLTAYSLSGNESIIGSIRWTEFAT
jgi:hypothetical protein